VRRQRSALLSLLAIAAADWVLVRVRNRARSRPTGVGVARCVDGVMVQSCARSVPGVGLFLNARRKRAVRRAEILSMISSRRGLSTPRGNIPIRLTTSSMPVFCSSSSRSGTVCRHCHRRVVAGGSARWVAPRLPGWVGGTRAIGCDMTPSRSLVGGRARAAEGAKRAQRVLGGARSSRS
jgi:hypothetical protein